MKEDFQSYSQAGQDSFAWRRNDCIGNGTFLDIGCGHPTSYNNTYGLERIGWTGLAVDIHADPNWNAQRNTRRIVADAVSLHWPIVLGSEFSQRRINYLSLDVDEHCLEVLQRLPLDIYSFNVITIEHDFYLRGPKMRDLERQILSQRGYTLAVADALWEGKPFEDWHVHP